MEPTHFQAIKAAILGFTELGRDALHVYAGLATLFLSALILRKSLRSGLPWLFVLGVAVAAELLDLYDDSVTTGQPRWGASAHDILNTLFWPTAILLLARWSRLFSPKPVAPLPQGGGPG